MTTSYISFLLIYLLGGTTFPLLVICLVFLHWLLFQPVRRWAAQPASSKTIADLARPTDQQPFIISGRDAEQFGLKLEKDDESTVASGYFVVCREYVPGGVNGKPPEKTTPAGSVVAIESPSVYQSMYKSIFDRSQPPTLGPAVTNGRTFKSERNIFYVVLRHGHLMLYPNAEQLEVKHVISLEYFDVSLFGGDEDLGEGELYIKRNAIKLSASGQIGEALAKPFYLFSDNCSDKEDFYFALLQSQSSRRDWDSGPPQPLNYDIAHIIGLVQRLHSNEQQIQVRWLNGLLGRLFLSVYKTSHVEDALRGKLAKKIARAKKPNFLTEMTLQQIEVGDSLPQLSDLRLKDLNVNGECCVEADVKYDGNFRLQIATTARIDLGSRFKAREVDLVLAVVIKKLSGHALVKLKSPPSNRLWVSFEQMPKLELSVEPIVSSRQVTYSIIRKAIESKIREVVAETIVLPHWDDSPFFDTMGYRYRGGIWETSKSKDASQSQAQAARSNADVVGNDSSVPESGASTLPSSPRASISESGIYSKRSSANLDDSLSARQQPESAKGQKPPKALRAGSISSAADPWLSNTNADSILRARKDARNMNRDATSKMIALSQMSRTQSSDSDRPILLRSTSYTSDIVPSDPSIVKEDTQETFESTNHVRHEDGAAQNNATSDIIQSTATIKDENVKARSDLVRASKAETTSKMKQSMAAIGAATSAARNWNWGSQARRGKVLAENNQAGSQSKPMGRGNPIPAMQQTAESLRNLKLYDGIKGSNLGENCDDAKNDHGNLTGASWRSKTDEDQPDDDNARSVLVIQAPSSDESVNTMLHQQEVVPPHSATGPPLSQ